jgi:hypothetical protein
MKQVLISVAFLTFIGWGHSQSSIRLDANSFDGVFEMEDPADFWQEFVVQRYITNTSGRNLALRWELEVEEAPNAWEYRICDKNASYAISAEARWFQPPVSVTLAPGETTLLDLDLLPRLASGCGKIYLYLSDAAVPGITIATVSFDICVQDEAIAAVEQSKGGLRVFPNPANDYISVSKNALVRQLWVSNILGKRVKSFPSTPNGRYDISDLPDGIYLVSLVDARRNVLKTIRISKRNPRP